MPKRAAKFDAESVRASWDEAADAYAAGQSSGRDYYRCEFFGAALRALKEPCPTAEALRSHPDLEDAARVPYYLFFDLVRPAQ